MKETVTIDVYEYCDEVKLLSDNSPIKDKGYGIDSHFQHYFSYIVAVSFIGGGNDVVINKYDVYFSENCQCHTRFVLSPQIYFH
jgi:hypothetical protein